MMQEVPMTYDEKVEMYMKLTKKELVTMLIEANKHLRNRPIEIQPIPNTLIKEFLKEWKEKDKECFYQPNKNSSGMECLNCGKNRWEHNIGHFDSTFF